MIEYAVLNRRQIGNSEALENEINHFARKGWRIICSIHKEIILARKVKILEDD